MNYLKNPFFAFVSEKAVLTICFYFVWRMKYWATDNLKQERFVSNVEKTLAREDVNRRGKKTDKKNILKRLVAKKYQGKSLLIK